MDITRHTAAGGEQTSNKGQSLEECTDDDGVCRDVQDGEEVNKMGQASMDTETLCKRWQHHTDGKDREAYIRVRELSGRVKGVTAKVVQDA